MKKGLFSTPFLILRISETEKKRVKGYFTRGGGKLEKSEKKSEN